MLINYISIKPKYLYMIEKLYISQQKNIINQHNVETKKTIVKKVRERE